MKTYFSHYALLGALAVFTATPLLAAPNDADNSGNNAVDAHQDTVTPEKQSNAKEDVEITRTIRRALVKDSTLSVYAHNIKIITTTDHVVYLRGTVSSSDDVSKIAALAKANAGQYPVKNQLSVASK